MIARRRLARLEESRSPRQVVLAWLSEAHTWPSLSAYLRTLLAEPERPLPLERILADVERAHRADGRRMRGRDIERAPDGAIEAAVLTYELILELDAAASSSIAAVRSQLPALETGLAALELATAQRLVTGDRRLAATRSRQRAMLEEVAAGLEADEDARTRLEGRHLDGHRALFADTARDWRAVRRAVAQLAERSAAPGRRRRPRPVGPSATERATIILDRARLAALGRSGDQTRTAAFIRAERSHEVDVTLALRALEPVVHHGEAKDVLGLSAPDRPMTSAVADHLDNLPPADQARQLRIVADELDPVG